MTETQYLLGWLVYLAGGTGCMLGLWLLVRKWNTRFRRALMAFFAVIVYLPGVTQPDMSFWSPAFLTTLYDALTYGPEVALRNGRLVAIVSAVSVLIAVILPTGRKTGKANKKPTKKQKPSNQAHQRKEPTY